MIPTRQSILAAAIVVASCSMSFGALPSGPVWTRQFGGIGGDSVFDILPDGGGGAIVGGQLTSQSSNLLNGFISRFDQFGNQSQLTVIDSGGDDLVRGLAIDAAGYIYAVGDTAGNLGAPNAGNLDAFITRLSPTGTPIWTKQFGTANFDDGFAAAVDPSGNVVLVGDTDGKLGSTDLQGYDAFAVKLTPAGDVLWIQQFGSNAFDDAHGIWIDSNGNSYVTGRTNADAYISKLDPQGTVIWTRTIASPAFDAAQRIVGDNQGHLYIDGVTDGALGGPNQGGRDAFIAKLDLDGAPLWIRQFGTSGSDGFVDMCLDGVGNPIAAGWSEGAFASPNQGQFDVIVCKVDVNGNRVAAWEFGTPNPDQADAVAVNSAGVIFSGGYTRGNLAGTLMGTDDAWVAAFQVPEPRVNALLTLVLAFFLLSNRRRFS